MRKGKYGLYLEPIAVIAFIMVLLNQLVPALLLVAFALLAERDEWLTHQTLTAATVLLARSIILTVLSFIMSVLSRVTSLLYFPPFIWIDQAFSYVDRILSIVLSVLVIACAIFGIITSLKSKMIKIPVISSVVGWVTGKK